MAAVVVGSQQVPCQVLLLTAAVGCLHEAGVGGMAVLALVKQAAQVIPTAHSKTQPSEAARGFGWTVRNLLAKATWLLEQRCSFG